MHDDVAELAGALVTSDRTAADALEPQLADCSRLAFRVAYSVLRHRQDAEDVAQDALVKAYRHFHRLRDPDRFRAWLVRTTWRLALDRRRGDRRREAREQREAAADPPSSGGEPVDALVARERAAHLWQAIDALPETLRVVVVLASIEGHDVADVARLLALPGGTVKSRLFLARQRLKEHLQWMRTDATRR
jgi:RNA polymerase sigma-70 factor, ECF subfamily